MSRWINADALMKRVEDSNKSAGLHLEDLRKIRRWIKTAPSIDIEPKRGEWKTSNLPKGEMKYCSECGFGQYIKDERTYNFCPNCGADMRERSGE